MALIVVIHMALFFLAMAEQPVDRNYYLEGWWLRATPVSDQLLPLATPCQLRSQPVHRRDDYTYTPGIGGHKFHTRALSWHEARRTCIEEGGELAIINSVAESRAIGDLFTKLGEVVGVNNIPDWAWIGIHDLFQEGEYVTIHSQSLARAGFTDWATGQPDNYQGIEDCGSVGSVGKLNDMHCDGPHMFICELPID